MDIHKSKRHLCGGGASTAAGVEMRWVGLLLLLCAAIPLSAQPDILYYKFNETSGALARNSAVPGQGYDSAILSAAPIWNTTNPRLGTACVNNTGQQRRMSSGYSMSERNGQNFTIEFWFRTSAGGYQDFCNDGDAFAIWLNNGRLQVYINGQVRLQSSATNLNNNTWRYAALTRSGNTFRLYWGSTSGGLSSSNTNYTTNFSTRALELLHWQGVVPATYEGEMDEFRLWSVARTAGQLNSGRGAEMSTGDMEVFDSANDFIKHQGTARYTRVNAAGFTDYTFSILNTRNGGDITFNPVTLPSVTGATASVITQPATISPGATTNFTVRVTPTQPEFYVSVDINSDRAPNPYQITIHGMVDTGRPEMLYFRLNEGSGTQTANDASPGRGANPAIFSTGPSWNSVSPRLGNAAAGSNANLPTGFTGTDLPRADFTVEFWMRTSTTTGTRTIVGDGQSFRIYLQNGALRVLGGVQVLSPGGTVNDNNWHHVALVSNPGTYGMRLYINGALQSETINFSFPFSNTEWTLFSHNGTDNFVGELDEFRVWAYARDAAEIAADLNWELFGHLDVQRPAATSIPHAGADNVGNAPVGVPLNLNYTLANTGGRLLTMGTPALTVGSLVNCTASVLSDPVGAAVAASGSVVGQLQVTPTASGPFSFVLTAASDDIDRPAYLVNVSGTGISGEIDVQRPVGNSIASGAPDALGGTFVGIAAPYTYTIANLGAGTLNIGAISALSLVNCGVAITPPGVTALGAGVSTTFQVDITAAAPGAFSFTLSIVNDDLDENPYDILVSGSAVNPPQLSAASPVSYGSSNVGVPTATVGHVISNAGGADLTITSISFVGTNPGDWSLLAPPTPPVVISAGGNLPLQGIFTPSATGARSAQLRLVSDSGAVPGTVTLIDLTGNGTEGVLGVPGSGTYGSSNVGVPSSSVPHTLTNTGSGPIEITGITPTGDWALAAPVVLPAVVGVGGSLNFSGIFTPTATGLRNGSFQIGWNQGGGVAATLTDFNVSGTGTFGLLGVNTPVNHGSSNVGVSTASFPHALNNTGTGPIQITAITLSGTNPGDWAFSPLPALPAVVNWGGNLNISTIFTPQATGARSALINVTWNQGVGSTITPITLDGNGTLAGIGVTSPVNYGSSNVGVSAPGQNHVVNNTGTGPMTVTAISVGGDWTVTNLPALPLMVAAGGNFNFDGLFTPTATGGRNATIQVSWNQGGGVNPQVTPIAVDGTGTFGDVSVPAIYDHGGVLVGSSSPRTHRIDSVGTGPIRILGVSMAGADAAYWSLSNLPAAGQPLASGAWWDFDAPFTPDAPRLFTAQIIVTWDQGAGSLAQQAVIDVSGTGGLASSVTGVSVGPDDGGPVRVQADVNGPATYLVDVAVTYTGGSNPGTAVISSAPGYTVAGNVIQDVPVGTTLVFYWDAYATEGHTTAADYVITLSPSISGFPGTPGSSAMFALTRQGGWTKFAAVADTPGTVSEHAMIRDVANDRLIAFGGIRSGVLSNETWAFDNASATWRRLTPSGTPPSPRREVLSVYDTARNRMIVFGGQSASGYTNDTFALYLTPGSEYWSQIAATSPATPSPRTHGTLIVDEANDRAILYGGYTSPKVHLDIWALSLAAGTESWGSGPLTTTNSPRTQSIGNASIYDPIGQRMLVYRAFTAELYELSLDVNLAWTNLTPAGTPSARRYPAVAYDSLRHAMILQGGLVGTATLTETWSLDIAGMTWSQLPDEPDSGGRFWHTGSYDETRDRFVMLGGRDGARVQNETQAVLDLAVPAWLPSPAAKSDAAGPEGRIGAVMCNDPMSNRVLLFGGQTLSGMANDVWMLDRNAPGPWTRLSTTGPTPAPRAFAAACYDAVNQRMIMFGGQGGSGRLDDLWTLDLAGTPSWTLWSSGVGPSARSYSAAAYRPGANRLMVFGGQGATQLNDYWEFNFLSSSWIQPTTSGTPPAARIAHGAVFDSAHNRFVVFCGTAGAAEVRDVWALDVSIPTPVWTDISATGTVPNPRARFAMAATPSGNSVYIHGGKQSYHQRGDTWRLDLSGPLAVWTLLADFTGAPTVRLEHAGCLDNAGRFVIGTGKYLNRLCSDVWELDITLPSPAWAQLAVPTTPPNLAFAQSAYDPVGNRMIVFSGVVNGAHTSGLWQLDLSVSPPAWSLLSAAGVPPSPRSGASFVYDGAHTPPRMLMYGGNAGTSAAVYLAELWALELTPGAEQWVQLSPSGAFTWRGCHSAVIDGSGGMVVFGGTDRYGKPSAIIQRMDLATLVWSNLATTGTAPAARNWHGAVYDGSGGRNRMLVYGGQGSGYFNDLWELNLTTLAWTQLASSGATPAASMSVVHDAAGERMLIFGGNNPTTVGDFLSYDLAGDTWTQISPTGSVPQARWGHAAIWDSVKNRLVVAGGLAGKAGSYLGEIPLTQNAGTEADTWFWGD